MGSQATKPVPPDPKLTNKNRSLKNRTAHGPSAQALRHAAVNPSDNHLVCWSYIGAALATKVQRHRGLSHGVEHPVAEAGDAAEHPAGHDAAPQRQPVEPS